MLPPELQGDVSAHRQSAENHRLGDAQRVEQGRQIIGELLDGHFVAVAGSLAEAAQVGGDHPAMPRERFELPGPHRVVQRKAMHQQQRNADAAFVVPDFRSLDQQRIMRTRFSPRLGKFTALPVRQHLFAGLQLRKTTSALFPFLRYPHEQTISKRAMLLLALQGLTCGQKVPGFLSVPGVGRTIRDSGRHSPPVPYRPQSATCTPRVRKWRIPSGLGYPPLGTLAPLMALGSIRSAKFKEERAMQLAYFRGLGIVVLATAALAASAARTSADDAAGQPSTIQLTAAIDEPDSPAAKRIDIDDAAKAADAAPVEKPKTRVPTPAKRTPSAAPLAKKLAEVKTAPAELDAKKSPGSDAAPVEVEPSANPTPKAEPTAEPPKKTPDAESLQPVPQAQESEPVPVEAASFKSITPGASTKTDVAAAWGEAKDSARKNGDLLELYAVEPFNRVEVSYNGEKVSSVVIRLDQAFPADAVAKQLDLATIRPVLVFNELGEVLGLSYPERGVLFAFEPSEEPKKPSMKVKQIILEPITAEPFVLRAETTLESRPELSRRDLEQALTLDRTNARAFWLYSRALVAVEKYDKAIVAAAEAVRLDPENASYRVTRAQILGQIGRLPEAIEEAEKAVETASETAARQGPRPVLAWATCWPPARNPTTARRSASTRRPSRWPIRW